MAVEDEEEEEEEGGPAGNVNVCASCKSFFSRSVRRRALLALSVDRVGNNNGGGLAALAALTVVVVDDIVNNMVQ